MVFEEQISQMIEGLGLNVLIKPFSYILFSGAFYFLIYFFLNVERKKQTWEKMHSFDKFLFITTCGFHIVIVPVLITITFILALFTFNLIFQLDLTGINFDYFKLIFSVILVTYICLLIYALKKRAPEDLPSMFSIISNKNITLIMRYSFIIDILIILLLAIFSSVVYYLQYFN